MSYHPTFKEKVDQLIHEYKYMLYGSSYFPIELAGENPNLQYST
jgi:hypothetical protein